jgi:DNA-binding Lrp family transcriptional regulator
MRRAKSKIKPEVHRDTYLVGRVSTEFFLRGFDLICQLDDDVASCLIIVTLWHASLGDTENSKPMGVRKLSRRLDMPFETVRRHVAKLLRSGACLAHEDGITLAATVRRSARATDVLRKIYLNAVRLLGSLGRIGLANHERRPSSPGSRRLDKEQTIVAVAALGVLLAAMKVLRGQFDGDLMSGLVFTAIRAANVQHIVNAVPEANRDIVPDSNRRPVSIAAIAASMRLPYETVRRHVAKLVREGKCIRVGRRGVMAPESAFRQMAVQANLVHKLAMGFLTELRSAGVKA